MNKERSSGILLHITSLPGRYGIGTMGEEAYRFIDFLIESQQKVWQLLPLGHTGFGDSPYQCFSAFAGNPLLIDPERLVWEGYIHQHDLPEPTGFSHDEAEFSKVTEYLYPLLSKAYHQFKTRFGVDKYKYEAFCRQNKFWLDDYAMFMALKKHFNNKSWSNWDEDIKMRKAEAMEKYRHQLKDQIAYYKFIQFLFYKQWLELKSYANINGIQVIGDIPLYVAFDSSDAWANPEIFEFDKAMNPVHVAGVPPDYFSETGQLWGNPIYNWDYLQKTEFSWWIERIKANFKLYDVLRIDHFRGLAAYWAVPYGEKTAVKGKWVKAPGRELFETIFNKLGNLPIIAEDLGVITPDVEALRDDFGFPGMKILQFAFDLSEENCFLPHTFTSNCIVYTGTHDNDTTLGRYNESTHEEKKMMKDYFNIDTHDPVWSFIRLAWSSVAYMAIVPMQDILKLDTQARMNFPGKASGYWKWRYKKGDLKAEHTAFLRHITKLFGRY